jgi:hypothetical protein
VFRRAQVFSLFTDNYLEYFPAERFGMEIFWKSTLRREIGKRGEKR